MAEIGGLHRSFEDQVLEAIMTEIAAQNVVDRSRIYPIVDTKKAIPHPTGQRDLLIYLDDVKADPGSYEGSGRHNFKLIRVIEIVLRSRMARDRVPSQEIHLTDDEDGHMRFENSVMNAVLGFWPSSGSGESENLLTVEQIHYEGGTKPKADTTDASWIQSTQKYRIKYTPQLSDHTGDGRAGWT